MPAIGAEVADAFIEVHASTGPFRRELKRDATLAAREASDDFGTEFTKAIDRDLDPLGAKVAVALREAGELGGRGLIDEVADQVRTRSDRISKAFAESITFGDFSPFIEQFNDFDDAIEEFDTRLRGLNKDGTLTNDTFDRLNASFNAYVKTLQDDAIKQALDEQRKASVAALEAEEKRVARQTQINDIFTRDFEKNVSKITAIQKRLTDELSDVDRSSPAFKAVAKDIKRLNGPLATVRKAVLGFNIGLGQLKGSRNDFLNFLGGVAGFIERGVGTGIAATFKGIGNGVSSLGKRLADADGPLSSFGLKLDSFGNSINKLGAGGIDGLVVQVAAFVIGLELLGAVLGPLIAGVSGLAAAIAALAVGIGGALAGGILALGPGLLALGAGIGVLNVAFSKLSKAQKAVFGPLKELFKEVRSSIQEKLFGGLGGQVDGLVSALAPLRPFLTQLAGVFRNWANQVIDEIGPKGPLAGTFASLGESLPGIFRTLLDLVSAAGGALTGLFAAAAPGAQRLFEGITRVVEQFSAWVNTSAGQQAINTFIQQAIDLLSSLWDIATQVGDTLRILFQGGGAGAAQILLEAISGIVEKMNAWLQTSAGQQALLAFFNNGIAVARGLGAIIGALIGLFDSLDTQFTRAGFQVLISGIVGTINAFTRLAIWTQDVIQAMSRFGTRVVAAGQQVALFGRVVALMAQSFVIALGKAFTAAGQRIALFARVATIMVRAFVIALGNGFTAVRNFIATLITRFVNFQVSIVLALNRVRLSFLSFLSTARNVVILVQSALGALAGFAGRALGSFARSIQNGINVAVGVLRTFGSRAFAALGSLPSIFTSIGLNIMRGLYNGLVSAAGSVLSFIRGLASEVASTFASVLGIFSPSRVFKTLGENIAEGLALGIESGVGRVNGAVSGLVDPNALSNVNAPISSLSGGQGASGGVAGVVAGVIASGAIQIITPFANPRLVALEVMDALAARGK